MVAHSARALGAQIDKYATETLLNAPHNDRVLYNKWLEQHEAANEEGRRWWGFCVLGILATAMSFWDWVIGILVFGIIPLALSTRSSEANKKVGWLVNPSMLVWLFLRLSVANVANPAIRNQVVWVEVVKTVYSLTFVFAWMEVSGLRFSGWLCHHTVAHLIVHVLCGPNASCKTPLLSLFMFGVFCYRRYWGSAVTDQVAALTAREELQQSRVETRFLRNLSETKSVFLRTLCHELRNPMTAVHGNTEILVQRLEQLTEQAHDEQTPELVAEVLAALPRMLKFGNNALVSTHHMSAVLNQSLTFAGLEAKHGIEISPSDRTTVNVRESMGTVLQMFQVVADRKGIELELVLPPGEDLMVQTNDNALKQNIINLLGNALKFTETGKITISARTVVSAEETLLQCSVADTGIGLTDEEQAHLFSAFSQANPEIGARYGGSGLGLHIVWESLKELNGSIRVASTKHKGSTFTFELPVVVGKQHCTALPPNEMSAVNQTLSNPDDRSLRQRRIDSKSVLIVDDEKLLRDLLKDQLSAVTEYHVTAASNGAEAVQQAGRTKFDVILMDVNMPVMGGLEATRAIRTGDGIAVNAKTPIVGLSANSLDTDLQLAKDAGMDSYLTKPYQFSELCQTIKNHISNAHTCTTPTTPDPNVASEHQTESVDAPWVELLPVEETDRDTAGPQAEKDPEYPDDGDDACDGTTGTQSIMVVDDNPNVRAVLVDIIQMLAPDVSVKEATDGCVAVELATTCEFELIFMDLHMPNMGGEEATGLIRSSELNSECPIVLVSGSVPNAEQEMRTWATDVVSKPYSISHIQELLEHAGIILSEQ
eukprot:TRINITY_DN1474_c0_g2_i5.p1 TRINITY_DN1474_c0_g2~~TRINITY_DN1474_c0_g2_i5.p1  ORF type:complete len:825 (-),score=158.51 TRINITY_DN1474_c0_g2_i5:16-2490(-)